MLDARGDVVRAGVGLGCGEVHVESSCRAVVGVEGVHARHFTCIGVHAAGGLARLDVACTARKTLAILRRLRKRDNRMNTNPTP